MVTLMVTKIEAELSMVMLTWVVWDFFGGR